MARDEETPHEGDEGTTGLLARIVFCSCALLCAVELAPVRPCSLALACFSSPGSLAELGRLGPARRTKSQESEEKVVRISQPASLPPWAGADYPGSCPRDYG